MTVTFDQFLDKIIGTSEPEDGFEIQGNVHAASHAIYEWKANNLSNAQMIELFNFDGTDPELTTVKTALNGLDKSDTIALQAAIHLAHDGVTLTGVTYDKNLLRTRFGL